MVSAPQPARGEQRWEVGRVPHSRDFTRKTLAPQPRSGWHILVPTPVPQKPSTTCSPFTKPCEALSCDLFVVIIQFNK